jgi:hypothetical protein
MSRQTAHALRAKTLAHSSPPAIRSSITPPPWRRANAKEWEVIATGHRHPPIVTQHLTAKGPDLQDARRRLRQPLRSGASPRSYTAVTLAAIVLVPFRACLLAGT